LSQVKPLVDGNVTMSTLRKSVQDLAATRRRREELADAKVGLERQARAGSKTTVYQSLVEAIESSPAEEDWYAVDLCRDWLTGSQGE